MKIKHSLPKGQRINKGSVKYKGKRISVFNNIDCETLGYWWFKDSKKWGKIGEVKGENFSSHCDGIKSTKAFRRKLKEWSKYMPRGTKFRLCSNLKGCDVYGKI